MKTVLAAVAFFSLALVTVAAAQTEDAPPDWRAVRPTSAFLWKYWQKDAKRYDVAVTPLVQHFAEVAKVTVRYDAATLDKVGPTTLSIGEGAEAPLLFDLCQIALAPRYTLLPEGGDRRFSVCPISDVAARAPRVDAESLNTLAAQEWALATFDLQGRDARAVERALLPLRSLSGRMESVNDSRSLMVLDIGGNLRRMHGLIPDVDRPREVVPLVPYQRPANADVGRMVVNLRSLMILFARNSGIADDKVHLAWDQQTGVVSGLIPKPLAATLDSAIEAADANFAKHAATDEADKKRFVQFSMSAPAGMDITQFSSRLRVLFDTEVAGGDARMVPKDDKSPTLYVRCRPWLEAEIREAAALLSN